MNELIVKQFNSKPIHTFVWNNKPCWIANEIVSTFDYADPSTTIGQCIEAEDFEIGVEYEVLIKESLRTFKEIANSQTKIELVRGNVNQLTLFYEDGLYGFLQYTDKPIGVKFRKWIRREVLPELRRNKEIIIQNQLEEFAAIKDGINNLIEDGLNKYSKFFRPTCFKKQSVIRYIKSRLGTEGTREEYKLVKQRILMILGCNKWEDIPVERFCSPETAIIIDQSIDIIARNRKSSQISLFENPNYHNLWANNKKIN